jgi:hypothetical protein
MNHNFKASIKSISTIPKDTLLVRTGVVNMDDTLQNISSTALPMDLHSTGQDITPSAILK